MNKLLISGCLLGQPVRYDGKAKTQQHAGLQVLIAEDRIVAFCPEVGGGLPVPRPAAEILTGDGMGVIAGSAQVITAAGGNVTQYFLAGAKLALALCHEHGITVAVLTELSPSCGSNEIYDGSFTRSRIAGSGVTAALLRANGIAVFNQHQFDIAIERLGA